MQYKNPTYGDVDLNRLQEIVSSYMAAGKDSKYQIIVGSDSQKVREGVYDFVSALIIHRLGNGGI